MNGNERPGGGTDPRPGSALLFGVVAGRDVEVELVGLAGLDLDLLFGADVPVLGDAVDGDDVGRAAGSGGLLVGGGLAVAGGDANEVLAGLQAALAGDGIGAVGDQGAALGALAVERHEGDDAVVERLADELDRAADGDAAAAIGTAGE